MWPHHHGQGACCGRGGAGRACSACVRACSPPRAWLVSSREVTGRVRGCVRAPHLERIASSMAPPHVCGCMIQATYCALFMPGGPRRQRARWRHTAWGCMRPVQCWQVGQHVPRMHAQDTGGGRGELPAQWCCWRWCCVCQPSTLVPLPTPKKPCGCTLPSAATLNWAALQPQGNPPRNTSL